MKKITRILLGSIGASIAFLLVWPVMIIETISPGPAPIRGARGMVMMLYSAIIMTIIYAAVGIYFWVR